MNKYNLIFKNKMIKLTSEISSNHNSNLSRSLKMIKLSADLGFDIVKFQLFQNRQIICKRNLRQIKRSR